jgi:hypothetical protein
MLHAIYSQAHVVSWLGTGGGIDIQCVSYYLSLFARLWTDAVRLENIKREPGQLDKIQRRAKMELEKFLRSQVASHNYQDSLQALASMFSDKYFSRVWIAQEIILGKTNVFQIWR